MAPLDAYTEPVRIAILFWFFVSIPMRFWLVLSVALLLTSCVTRPPLQRAEPTPPVSTTRSQVYYQATKWQLLPGWRDTDPRPGLNAWQESCRVLAKRKGWQRVCTDLKQVETSDVTALRVYFEQNFTAYQIVEREQQINSDEKTTGLITGYYEPQLEGSLSASNKATYPLYGVPRDLITVDLSSLYPELKSLRLRGRIEQKKLLPYYTRAQIEAGQGPRPSDILAWVNDPIELFFLQIQGSGRIKLADGSLLRVGYADQNGQPYKSIGKWLIERGELKPEQASMQGIQKWARAHPERLDELLNANPSYVFFRILPQADGGPIGALGVPLTDRWSLAIDPQYIPLGSPVYLSTTEPNSSTPLQRLMYAQDTGGAIRGAIRADFFWGFGAEAGRQAGRMKQRGSMWVLLPRDVEPPERVQLK